jgi:hypothetical protein
MGEGEAEDPGHIGPRSQRYGDSGPPDGRDRLAHRAVHQRSTASTTTEGVPPDPSTKTLAAGEELQMWLGT